ANFLSARTRLPSAWAHRSRNCSSAAVAPGRFIPDPLQAITEFDHGSQDLVPLEQLTQLPARLRVEQCRMSNEQLRCASFEHGSAFLLRQLVTHRPNYSTTVVAQDMQAV